MSQRPGASLIPGINLNSASNGTDESTGVPPFSQRRTSAPSVETKDWRHLFGALLSPASARTSLPAQSTDVTGLMTEKC